MNGNKSFLSDKYDRSTAFTLFEYNEKLDVVKKSPLHTSSIGNIFLSSDMDKQGNIVIISATGNIIQAERFSSESNYSNSNTVQTKLAIDNKTRVVAHVSINNATTGEYLLSLKYKGEKKDYQSDLIKFSFVDNKVYTNSDLYNKDFREVINTSAVITCDLGKAKMGSLEDFYTTQLITTSDNKHILLRESVTIAPGTNQLSSTYMGGESVLDIYDNNLKLLKRHFFPRVIKDVVSMGILSTVYEKGNKLYLFAPHSERTTRTCALSIIDLNDYSIKDCAIIDKDGFKKSGKTDSRAVIWFQDGFVIPYSNYKTPAVSRFQYFSEFVKLAY